MEQAIEFIQSNVQYAPYIIFGLLLLAGFNLPVSEDVMLFISATLAASYPDNLIPLFIGVFLGAFFSDLICFTIGRIFGATLFEKDGFLTRFISQEKIRKIEVFYDKHGIITLILGRFIPFGVRNGLFLAAGIGKMSYLKFSLSDLLACTISSVFFFTLYYKVGKPVLEYVQKGNIVIFSIAVVVVLFVWLYPKYHKIPPHK